MNRATLVFILKRVAQLVPQLLAISAAVFVLIRLLPGDPARALLGPHATARGVASLSAQMGLNRPIPEQYWIYVKGILHGDLGHSWFTGQSVTTDLAQRAPATLELITYAFLVAIVVGACIGAVSASRGDRGVIARGITWYTRLAGAFPDFWMGLLAIYVFFYRLRIAPAPLGRLGITAIPPKTITGFYTVDSLLTENVFSWGGIGQYAVQAVGNSDFAAIQGFVLLAATFTVLVYLLVDLIHLAIDPRVAY